MRDICSALEKAINDGRKAALCILIETEGSTPRKAGSKMIVFEDRHITGSVGGGSFEADVIEKAIDVIRQNKPRKFRFDLTDDLKMHCGGMAEVYIEPVIPHYKLYIFGAGHVGRAVAELAVQFGFSVHLIDNRKDLIEKMNIQGVTTIHSDLTKAAREIEFDERTFIIIVTPEHDKDEEITAFCAKQTSAYLGMIGSKKKVALARNNFLEKFHLSEEQVNRINMPIGIPFNAQTPREIAISILAKIIDVKNNL